eukprot:2942755-Lingulodinium_polyedra.AAC.1
MVCRGSRGGHNTRNNGRAQIFEHEGDWLLYETTSDDLQYLFIEHSAWRCFEILDIAPAD